MSKVSFRARALDATRAMPVFNADELSDLAEYATINRAIPQMPTGMEKEEEMELHLQQAISAQQAQCTGQTVAEQVVIPIPSVTSIVDNTFNKLHPPDYKSCKALIKAQTLNLCEPSLPGYDIDSEDENFLDRVRISDLEISDEQFETIMDRLENASERQVASINDAKALVNADDDIVVTVYDYWLNKRLKLKRPLVTHVRCERKDGSTTFDPYVAFRRRGEKMQTRKNRKNDEESYEKILKLRQDLHRLVTLCDMVKRREKTKRELVNMDVDVFDFRFRQQDWSSTLYDQVVKEARPSFTFNKDDLNCVTPAVSPRPPPKSLVARKRKHKKTSGGGFDDGTASKEWLIQNAQHWNRLTSASPPVSPVKPSQLPPSRDPSALLDSSLTNSVAHEIDGPFAFCRKRGCSYIPAKRIFTPSTRTPIQDQDELDGSETEGYAHTYLPDSTHNALLKYTGLTRRRVGRGGRVILDRLPFRTLETRPQTLNCPPSTSTSQNERFSTYYVPCGRPEDRASDFSPPRESQSSLPYSHLFYSRFPSRDSQPAAQKFSDDIRGDPEKFDETKLDDKPLRNCVQSRCTSGVSQEKVSGTLDAQRESNVTQTTRFKSGGGSYRVVSGMVNSNAGACTVQLHSAQTAGEAVMSGSQAMKLMHNRDITPHHLIINNNMTAPSSPTLNHRPPVSLIDKGRSGSGVEWPLPLSPAQSPLHAECVQAPVSHFSPSSVSPNSDASLPPVTQVSQDHFPTVNSSLMKPVR